MYSANETALCVNVIIKPRLNGYINSTEHVNSPVYFQMHSSRKLPIDLVIWLYYHAVMHRDVNHIAPKLQPRTGKQAYNRISHAISRLYRNSPEKKRSLTTCKCKWGWGRERERELGNLLVWIYFGEGVIKTALLYASRGQRFNCVKLQGKPVARLFPIIPIIQLSSLANSFHEDELR